MTTPDYRFYEAKRLADQGTGALGSGCDLARLLWKIQHNDPYIENDLSRAYEIYNRRRQSRFLLEAMLLAPDSTSEKICLAMATRPEMIDYYRHYFFDLTVFRDKFEVCDFISELPDEKDRITKKMALTQGFSYIISHFTGGSLDLSPMDMIKRVQSGAYRMYQQGISSTISSEEAKEAKSWAGIVKGIAEFINKNDRRDPQAEFLEEFKVMFEHGKPIDSIDLLDSNDVVRG